MAEIHGKCSTPFGIYEVGTPLGGNLLTKLPSAQRLSASMRLAHLGVFR